MIWAAAWLVAQPRPATVGDTVWLSSKVPLAARQILRAQPWSLGEIGQVLGPPEVDYEGDSATVRYPVAFWYPGVHPVSVPGPIVVNPEGRSDTLSTRFITVHVASVLPLRVPRDSLIPRDAADLFPQAERSLLPLALLWLVAGVMALGVAWLRRTRQRRAPPPAGPPVARPLVNPVLHQWGQAGETRAAAEGWSQLIHARLSSGPADDAAAAIATGLDEIGFQPGTLPASVEQLLEQAAAWITARDRAR